MAVERGNPLPLGVYWVDVFEPQSQKFNAWLTKYRGAVEVLKVEHSDAITDFLGNEQFPSRDWVLFRINQTPVVIWEGPGFPTIAERGEHTQESDTVQKPAPEDLDFELPTLINPTTPGGMVMWTAVGLVAAALLIGKVAK